MSESTCLNNHSLSIVFQEKVVLSMGKASSLAPNSTARAVPPAAATLQHAAKGFKHTSYFVTGNTEMFTQG